MFTKEAANCFIFASNTKIKHFFEMQEYSKKRFTITSALPYANGPLHIGHLAGAYIPGDIFARYQRLKKNDVLYVCGSDEHGAAITIKAKKEGTTPKAIIDRYHQQIKESFEAFGMSFDFYHRTSERTHHDLSQEFFLNLHQKGVFIEKTTEQYFDETYKQFLADRYITGTCPNCHNPAAYGDQCERCGTSLNPSDLINPISTLSGKRPVLKETTHWYLPLENYQTWLDQWLLKGKKSILKPNVYGQCSSWLQSGLQARSMTRDLDWGVPVPLPEAHGKKLYVWLDAPIGYISASKQWAIETGKDWEVYWKKQADPGQNSHLIHFIGKDNIVFHCIIFPAILHAHGEYILPENIPANEFLNLEGEKLSTSRNHAVWLHEYLDELPGKQDELRYVLTSILPETSDSEFTWKDYQARVNNELVAIFGNFINRVLVLSQKYFDGKVMPAENTTEADNEVMRQIKAIPVKIERAIETYHFREALSLFMQVARIGNKYLADEEPWKKFTSDPQRVQTILNISIQIAGNLTVLSQIFLPFTAARLKGMLNMGDLDWDSVGDFSILPASHSLGEPKLLFEKIQDEQVAFQVTKLEEIKRLNLGATEATSLKSNISFEDFSKLDIRTGIIESAEKVAKTKRLLKLSVNTGIDHRTIVSGIAEHYNPEELIGQQVTVLMNLEPRKLKGILSEGMILMAEDNSGKLAFIAPPHPFQKGSEVR